MVNVRRYLFGQLRRDLARKMVFVAGPRQVGKTTLAKSLPGAMVECKWGDQPVDKSLFYLKARFPDCSAWQVSMTGIKDYRTVEGIRVAPALALLGTLV